ncbi:MAG: MFS transporter [Pseudomonadota bacterium]
MLSFLRENARWLFAGLTLTFASSFGQSYFISLFAGEIRAEFGLTDGGFGGLYTVATLASGLLLLSRGSWADTVPARRLTLFIAFGLAGAALLMAGVKSVPILLLSLFLLRFCGQGMFTHIAITTMARWFVASRGRAVSIAGIGHSLGEAILPFIVVQLLLVLAWRQVWLLTAAVLLLALLPLLMGLLARDRQPTGQELSVGTGGLGGRHWRRGEVLRHWLFWAIVPMVLTPGFIGTVVFFHQVHVSEVKGWSLAAMAPAYPVYAVVTVVTAITTGWAIDRIGPLAFLPLVLLPMALGISFIGPSETVWGWIAALGIIGITQGMSATLWGTFLPYLYGTDHLGSVRAITAAIMVFSTAIGPGLTGWIIDLGVDFPDQGLAMALWCVALSAAMVLVGRRLARETVSA